MKYLTDLKNLTNLMYMLYLSDHVNLICGTVSKSFGTVVLSLMGQ